MKKTYKGQITTEFRWIIPILLGISKSTIIPNGIVYSLHILMFINIGISLRTKK